MDKLEIWVDEYTDRLLELSQQQLSPFQAAYVVTYNPSSQDFDFQPIAQADFFELGPIADVQQDREN